MKAMNKKVSSHYVPQAYLRKFINPEKKLYIKNKKTGSIRQGFTKSVNYLDDFYVVDTVDEKNSQEIEQTLGHLESVSLPLLNKLSEANISSNSEWADVAIYITIQYGRTPKYKRQLKEIMGIYTNARIRQMLEKASINENAYEDLKKINQEETGGFKVPSQTELKSLLEKEIVESEITYGNNIYVRTFFEEAYTLADYILKKRWRVMHRTGEATFITNDFPVIVNIYSIDGKEDMAGLSYMSLADRIYFPISPDVCLIIFCDESNDGNIDHFNTIEKDVLEINKIIYESAEQYVIANNEKDLKQHT